MYVTFFFRHAEQLKKKKRKKAPPERLFRNAVRVRESRRQKRAGRPSCARKEQKKISPIVGARSARGAARGFGPRDRPRSTAETSAVARHATRRGSRARGSAATGRARRRFGRARCAELCTLSRRRVVPVRGDSALARERVAGGDAARRLGERRDPASQNRPRRHRDGWEGSNRDRSAAGNESRPFKGCSKNISTFREFRFEVGSGCPVSGSPADVGSRIRNAARGKPEVKATEPREARQKNKLSRHGASTRFARARVHRSPWRRASRHSRKVTRQPRRSPRSTNARLAPRSRFPRFVREPSSSAVPATLPRATA